MLSIGQLAPPLSVSTICGGEWNLGQNRSERGTFVFFLRDPGDVLCAECMSDLETKMNCFAEARIDVLALSSQSRERTIEAATKVGVSKIPLGFNGSVDQALDWGVMVSELPYGSVPRHVFESAMFMIGPDNKVLEAVVSSAALWRPDFDRILLSLNSDPYRGSVIRRVWQGQEERLTFPDGRGGRPVWSRHVARNE